MKTINNIYDQPLTPEDELLLTRNQLQSVMNTIDAIILVVDKDLVVRFANKNLSDLWGLDPLSLVGRKKPEVITSKIKHLFKDPESFQNRLFWLYDHMHEVAYDEVEMLLPQKRLFARHSAPVIDENGSILGRVEVYTDITKDRKMEQDLQTQNAQLLAFREIAVEVSQSLNLEEILNSSVKRVQDALRVDGACLCLGDCFPETQDMVINKGLNPQVHEAICDFIQSYLRSLPEAERQQVSILPVESNPRFESPHHACLEDYQSITILPLVSNDCFLGRMCLTDSTAVPLLEERQGILYLISSQISAAIKNANLFAETRRRQRVEQILNKVAIQILASQGLERILQTVVQEARELFQCDSSGIALLDENDGRLYWRFGAGNCLMKAASTPCLSHRRLPIQKCPLWFCEDEGDTTKLFQKISEQRVSSNGNVRPAHLWVPMQTGKKWIGGIYIIDAERTAFSADDAALLAGLANQAAIALENAALYEQVQHMAVLEERDRLARGMHDGLAQVLGYLRVKSETVERWLTLENVDHALEELKSMNQVINETYEDLRGVIMGLKTIIQPGPDLLFNVEEALRCFGVDHDLETNLVVNNADLSSLSLEIQIQLIRVLQECLNNVVKHANASTVSLKFDQADQGIKVTIKDDGQGFDLIKLAEPSWKFIGLRTIRERVETVGGSFHVDSGPGLGANVVVTLPFYNVATQSASMEQLWGKTGEIEYFPHICWWHVWAVTKM